MNNNWELKQKGFIFEFWQQIVKKNNKEQTLDLIKHNGAVAVLIVDGDQLVLVEQFRYPLQQNIIEIVAGKINVDEVDTLSVAKRETKEELGIELKNIKLFDVIRPSGGVCSEEITIYVAEVESYTDSRNFDDTEEVFMKKIKIKDAVNKVINNEIIDGKTAYAILRYYNERNKSK